MLLDIEYLQAVSRGSDFGQFSRSNSFWPK